MPATKKKSTKSTTTTSRTKSATTTDKLALSLAQTNIAEDSVPQQHDPSMGYSALQLEAMLDTFNLDGELQSYYCHPRNAPRSLNRLLPPRRAAAHSHLQALRRSQAHRLQSLQRHWDTAVESLEPQIRGMLLERFVSEFHGDREAALRGVVEGTLRSRQPPMGRVEESARKR